MERISKHISYSEATRSRTAEKYNIDNHPDQRQLYVMKNLAEGIFEPVRSHFKQPLYISSFYRSPNLNKRIGGAYRSDHMIKEDIAAIDIDNDVFESWTKVSNADIFWYIYDNLDFYKLIWEFGSNHNPAWVHVSYSTDQCKNRRKHVYRAHRPKGKTAYSKFIESNHR